jgi:hypothetical protein
LEDLENLGPALPPPCADEPADPGTKVLPFAGLLLGVGALSAEELKKRHTLVPARGTWEATWRSVP